LVPQPAFSTETVLIPSSPLRYRSFLVDSLKSGEGVKMQWIVWERRNRLFPDCAWINLVIALTMGIGALTRRTLKEPKRNIEANIAKIIFKDRQFQVER